MANTERPEKLYETSNPLLLYCGEHSSKLHPVQEKLIQVTLQHSRKMMMGSPDELQLLANLCRAIGAKKTLDIGVFTGFSALSIALALPSDGTVIACDITDEYPSIGKPFWKEAGVDGKIDLRIGPAIETLQSLLDEGQSGTFDFAFIDADKQGYIHYYEKCLQLLRPGGIIAIDNVLKGGKVLDPNINDPDTITIQALNKMLMKDKRVHVNMLNIADGLTLAFKC